MPHEVRFMLIDDSELALKIHTKMLQRAFPGCPVQSFSDPTKALGFLSANHQEPAQLPHIVLLDIIMPRLNGFEFMDALRNALEAPVLPYKVFMLSSTIDQDEIYRANHHPNVECILYKPLDTDRLKSLMG